MLIHGPNGAARPLSVVGALNHRIPASLRAPIYTSAAAIAPLTLAGGRPGVVLGEVAAITAAALLAPAAGVTKIVLPTERAGRAAGAAVVTTEQALRPYGKLAKWAIPLAAASLAAMGLRELLFHRDAQPPTTTIGSVG
jgi:hypothetical protein